MNVQGQRACKESLSGFVIPPQTNDSEEEKTGLRAVAGVT